MILIKKLSLIIKQFLIFLGYYIVDTIMYIVNQEYKNFDGFGLHIYTGLFGAGKTTAMVRDAYNICKQYKGMNVLTNIKLINFPKDTNIMPLVHYKQIIDAPSNTLIVLDEISSIFNSRDWKKDGIPPTLLSHLLQVRKRKKMMLATAQKWKHVDKLIRDITFNVYTCRTIAKRWTWTYTYNAIDVEDENVMAPASPTNVRAFIMTNKIRRLFDTDELVEKLEKSEYISDVEILEKQGNVDMVVVGGEKKKNGLLRRGKKAK